MTALALVLGAGCRCGGVPEDLQVSGEQGYVRCLAAPPPAARSWKVGELQLELSGRHLKVTGPESLRVVAYAGPGPASETPEPTFLQLEAAEPHLAIMIGSVGDVPEATIRHLRRAAGAVFPTLVLASGRDRYEDLQFALTKLENDEKARVIDISSLHSIEMGPHLWVLVPGAVTGRYARDTGSCGVSLEDLERLPASVSERLEGKHVWLLSWQAPSSHGPHGITRVGSGLDVGEPALDALARAVGAKGGLFAWPEARSMQPAVADGSARAEPGKPYEDLGLVVPPLAGPTPMRDDGSRPRPGFARLQLDAKGMMLLESD